MDERTAYIALNMMEGVGPVGVRALSRALGSAAAIFDASKDDLRRADGIGPTTVERLLKQRDTVDVESEITRAEAEGCRILTLIDPEYPEVLKPIHDPPLALYIKGTLQARDRHAIAIVGTRRPTHYGLQTAGRLAYQLAQAGFTVTSGLALGIDTAAHEGALRGDGRTLAVLGAGMRRLYPTENAALAERIAEHGAVLSEFPMDRAPDKTTFPMRNRIVSGLSAGVLVVEAGRRSGATITADQALAQGRDVFSVPGRIDSYASLGTNALLKQGAIPVTDVDDVLEHYASLLPAGKREAQVAAAPRPDLSSEEERLVALVGQGIEDVDGLIRASDLAPATVNATLIALELKRVARARPGGRVELV